jgi:hypothetical protein
MRINKAWKEDGVTQIDGFISVASGQIAPASNFRDAVAGD